MRGPRAADATNRMPKRPERDGAGLKPARPPEAAADAERVRPADVALGVASRTYRLGRIALLPGRMLSRSFLVEPVLRRGAEGLAATGRDVEARGRQRLEESAGEILAAPETARAVDRVLAGPVPDALGDETIERLARRVLESPAFERIARDAAASPVVRELTEDALRSPEFQRLLEEMLAGPVRNAVVSQTMTFGDEVASSVRAAASRLDDTVERAVRSAVRRPPRTVEAAAEVLRYAGLVSRGGGFVVDVAITQLAALVVGALVGVVGSFIGASPPDRLVATLAGVGWTVFVGGYFVFFWTTAGQTPGMRPLRLRVTGADGGRLRVRRALVRLVGAWLALAPLGAGYLPVLVDRKRRALPDFLAKTVVVHEATAAPELSARTVPSP